MPTYKLTVEYKGTSFGGWQVQNNAETVQGKLQQALQIVLRQPIKIQGASRTDAGVHAVGQVASFGFSEFIDPHKLTRSLCALAGPHIAVTKVEAVNDNFNARFAATGKHYVYKVLNRRASSPLLRETTWHVASPLNLELMRRCASQLVGTHDFAGFRSSDCERHSTERTITAVDIVVEGAVIEIHVRGTAFLKNMVRIIAGTLVDISRGALHDDTIDILFNSKDREQAGRTAPACGLTLQEVFF